jgi:hypothetical protein
MENRIEFLPVKRIVKQIWKFKLTLSLKPWTTSEEDFPLQWGAGAKTGVIVRSARKSIPLLANNWSIFGTGSKKLCSLPHKLSMCQLKDLFRTNSKNRKDCSEQHSVLGFSIPRVEIHQLYNSAISVFD